MLFADIAKVEIEICDRGLASIAHGFDILDDCGTGKRQATQLSLTKKSKWSTNQRMVLPEPATHTKSCQVVSESGRSGRGAHVFHKSRGVVQNLLISNSGIYFLGRTMSRFPRDEHYVQCCGSLTDLVARAIYEDPVAVDSLQGRFSLDI